LPAWWDDETQEECEALGTTDQGWPSLRNKISKADVIRHYGDEKFPMHLRMFGELVYGRGIMGQDGSMIRKMLAAQESGDGYVSVLNATT
jgi:mitochondrial splicing suppressor protein 51